MWYANRVSTALILLYSPPDLLRSRSGAIFNTLKPSPDDTLAVFGCGAVGMAAILAAKHLGVQTIIAVDLVQSRLELAKEFGATNTVVGSDKDALDQIRSHTKWNLGVTHAVEATGVLPVLKTAFDSLASFGHLASIGNPGVGITPPFEINDVVNGGKTWSGVIMGGGDPQQVSIQDLALAILLIACTARPCPSCSTCIDKESSPSKG